MTRTALIVTVPTADAVVGRRREALTSDGPLGVPAHVTLLYPFIPSTELGPDTVQKLAEAVAQIRPFHFELARTAWFGVDVLWLAPDRDEPFADLANVVQEAYPDLSQYSGRYDAFVPHLTIGEGAHHSKMIAAEKDLQPWLPIHHPTKAYPQTARTSRGTQP